MSATKAATRIPVPLRVAPPPVADVLNAAQYERLSPNHAFTATTKPGHLLQFLLRGSVTQVCNGRRYDLKTGDLIWYHEDEWVEGRVMEAPWEYYSVNFLAPRLAPPPYEDRVTRHSIDKIAPLFGRLVGAWKSTEPDGFARACRVHAALLDLIACLAMSPATAVGAVGSDGLWWEIEQRIRDDFSVRVSMTDLENWSGRGQATIVRACRSAVGDSPMRRVRQLRMSYARGLVRYSDHNVSEIAARLGYTRVHEFSRDYRQHFGLPPSHDAAQHRDRPGRHR